MCPKIIFNYTNKYELSLNQVYGCFQFLRILMAERDSFLISIVTGTFQPFVLPDTDKR